MGFLSSATSYTHKSQNHYQNLLNSSSDCSKKSNVLESLDNIGVGDTIERITPNDIQDAIKLISGEYLIYCDNKLHYLSSILL